MSFDKTLLPESVSYYESQGLKLIGKGRWRTTECNFHGGSDSLRINTANGGFICMSCGVKGGDVLAYHMEAHGLDFVEACKALNAWSDDGEPRKPQKPRTLSATAALEALAHESNLIAVAGGNIAYGVILSDDDRARVLTAANRVANVWEAFR